MPAEHNDFSAYAPTSSQGFVTIFMKNNVFQMCLHYCFLHILAKDLQSICLIVMF